MFANPTGRLQCWYAQVATFEESTDQVQSGIDHVLDDVILALEDIEGRPLLRMMALGR